MGMKTLLLNSPWLNTDEEYGIKSGTRWAAIRKRDRSMPYYPFPYFMAWTATLLKKHGVDIHIKDAVAEELSIHDCLIYLERLNPDLVVIEVFTPSIYVDLKFAKYIKSSIGSLIAFCGAHTTALPGDILKNDFVDFAFSGEYAHTLLELLPALINNKKELSQIKGLAFKKNGDIIINPRRTEIENMDEIEFPDRGGLPVYRYSEPLSKYYPNAKIMSTKGCPYDCIFCIEPLMYKKNYEKRDILNVIKEIKMLKNRYGVKEIYFDDAIITVSRAREIAQAILDYKVKIAWTCWIDWRIDLESIKLLKKSGCYALKIGIESAHSDIIKKIRKPKYVNNINKVLKDTKKARVLTHGSFMLGLPYETKQSLHDTIDMAFGLGLDSCQFSIATPLPGTPFHTMAIKKNWLVATDWNDYDSLNLSAIEYPGCSKYDIMKAMEEVNRRKVKQFFKKPLNVLAYTWKLYQLHGFHKFSQEMKQKASYILKNI